MGACKVIYVFNCSECPNSQSTPMSMTSLYCKKTGSIISREDADTFFEFPENCPLES
jgi:hypothetical protein